MFPGLSPAQKQDKHIMLSLVVKVVLDLAHSVWRSGDGCFQKNVGSEPFCPTNFMGSLCAGSRPGDEFWLGAPAPLFVNNDKCLHDLGCA